MKMLFGPTAGILLLAVSNLPAATLYVSPGSPNPTPPYGTWSTAAHAIQDAVNAAAPDDTIFVTNGVHAGGLTVAKPLTMLGVNGPQFTIIKGAGVSRCVSITNGVNLSGFTITNGWAQDGGGVWCNSTNAYLTNCIIAGNSATQNGGGAYGATLYNCVVKGNSAPNGTGGGTYSSMLFNCTVVGNSANSGGGAAGGILYNSILYYNTALNGTNYLNNFYLLYCCTMPAVATGEGNILGPPSFAGDPGSLRLQSNSPCINAGNNAFVSGPTDLDGNSRIAGGTVDIGAYEYQGSGGSNAPVITLQPRSTAGLPGTNVTFSAAAEGSLPLFWQWFFNEAAIPGATGSSVTVMGATTNQAGNYFAVVTNSFGSATSQVAVLQIIVLPNDKPVFTEQPLSQTVPVGADVQFSASAGPSPLAWQWLFNGTAIPGAIYSSLTLSSVTTNQSGGYSVVVVNAAGSATSQVAVLTVQASAPWIKQQPYSQPALVGTNVTFSVVAAGSLPLSFQWEFNSNPLPGATDSSLTLTGVTTSQTGDYVVVVTNFLGSVTSQVAVLTVYTGPGTPPSITVQPVSQTASTGSDVRFTVYASGSVPLSWQWKFNGTAIPGATNSTLTLTDVTTNNAGLYSVTITNALGNIASTPATLTIPAPVASYVWQNSPNPAPPYNSWATAARNIQDAVDAASPGAEIVVTNGFYATGGRSGNRVMVDKPVTLHSVNGPDFTIIQGYQVPSTNGAIRCVSLAPGAVLRGFTLRGGGATETSTWFGGGVYCPSTSATVVGCVLSDNSAAGTGGGANGCTLRNCTLSGNVAGIGGGASGSLLNNCILNGNSASEGGGAYGSTLNNCVLTSNSGSQEGGGAAESTLNNCTLTGNSSPYGGGTYNGTLNNCISFYNTATGDGSNYLNSTMAYCCTTPLPSGPGNIEAEPVLASFSHISAQSPCIGAGSAAYVTDVDIDGEPWLNPPCIGADQFISGQTTGPLSVAIVAGYTNVGPGLAVPFQALIDGRLAASAWDFKDGVVVSNRPYGSHAWTAPGQYLVSLTAYNDSYPGGVSATVQVQVTATEVFYVNAANTTPLPPYTNWAGAATNIQDAIDAGTQPGRVVLVTDGVYGTDGRSVDGVVTNRVAVPLGVEVRSVNGPAVTLITGDGLRCAYVSANSVLNGFTLTNGYSSQDGGGAWCENLAVVTNCILSGNSAASYGGGVYGGTLNNCTLSANLAPGGGAARDTTLNHCVLRSNSAESYGGGVYGGVLNNCTLSGNSTKGLGGGAYGGILNNCVLTGNSASSGGGEYSDGVASPGTLNNCTLTFNSADEGGGTCGGVLNNCIVFYNTAANGPNYYNSAFSYSCTTPLPPGTGNLGVEPLLASATHLSADSPCIGRGSAAYASGVDIDGEPWLNPPCIGADQFVPGQTLGPLTVSIAATYTNVSTDFAVSFQAVIDGRLSSSVWDFGDGVVESNRPSATHIWTAPGQYVVSLTGYNDSHPDGVSATLVVQVGPAQVYYVNAANTTPAPPYTSLATAATNIQDAIDAGTQPGRLVLVSDGVYASGGRAVSGVTNRVVVPQGVEVRSANGAAVTVISGGGIRCAYVGPDAVLSGFTLTNGYAGDGGGAWCEVSGVVTNCTFSGNGASNSGGGAYGGTLIDCTLTNNSSALGGGGAVGGTLIRCALLGNSANTGGGASDATLSQCVLKGNSASYGGGAMWSVLNNCTVMGNGFGVVGGGAFGCTLNNCIVYSNVDQFGANYSNSKLSYCCTTPLPDDGVGNIDKDPLVVDFPGGNLRLQPNSPCINAGNNAFVSDATDLDGNPRIAGGTVDIGAYEFQGSGSMISYAWLQQYGLPTDGSADLDDPDGDGMNNWQEWVCGTNPTNSLSVLRMLSAAPVGGNVTVRWQSVAGINYFLVRTEDISSMAALAPTNSITNIVLVATGIAGQTNATSYTDTNAVGGGTFFYRVGVTGP